MDLSTASSGSSKMSFPLSSLPTALIEKVINKLHWKSYFRIQQTCRVMKEFIQDNSYITCFVEKHCRLIRVGEFYSGTLIVDYDCADKRNGLLPPENLRNVRLSQLAVILDADLTFEQAYDDLKKHRITASRLSLGIGSIQIGLTKEECSKLVKLIKPVSVLLNALGSWKELIPLKQLQEMELVIEADDVLAALPKLSRFQKIKMSIIGFDWTKTDDELLDFVQSLIKVYLAANPTNHILGFCFLDERMSPIPFVDIMGKFRHFKPSIEVQGWCTTILKFQLNSTGYYCELCLSISANYACILSVNSPCAIVKDTVLYA